MSELEQLVGELSTEELIRLEQLLRQADATDERLRANAPKQAEMVQLPLSQSAG